MYTEEYSDINNSYEDSYNDYDYQEQEQKPSFWNDNKGLIIKIIIIVLCVIILFWLILKLKGNNNNNENSNAQVNNATSVYNNNVEAFRAVAEKYFFIDGNMPKNSETKVVTLNDLITDGRINNLVDSENNACNINSSYASLVKEDDYVLTINLVCSSLNDPKVYYYDYDNNNVCMNCTGFTYMDGSQIDEPSDNEQEPSYSCKEWSDWTTEKINDNSLEVRERTLVKGEKKGSAIQKVVYGNWSEYTTTEIKPSDNLEVEMTTKKEQVWVEKTSNSAVTESSTIKNINATTSGGGSYSYCPNGYTKDGKKCYKIVTGTLTYTQYNSYEVINKPCAGPSYNSDGERVYKGCQYKKYTSLKTGTHPTTTTYTYQELVTKDVTYYRSRTKTIETAYEDSVFTDYMEEKNLPSGYVKVAGSEKKEYSYKLKVCEK